MSDLFQDQQALLARQCDVLNRLRTGMAFSRRRLPDTLTPAELEVPEIAERIAALNDRFTKLQDQFAGAMRHAHGMIGERYRSFLDVVAWAVHQDIIPSPEDWYELRALRNRLTHDYDLGADEVIEVIQTLLESIDALTGMIDRFEGFCQHTGLLPHAFPTSQD